MKSGLFDGKISNGPLSNGWAKAVVCVSMSLSQTIPAQIQAKRHLINYLCVHPSINPIWILPHSIVPNIPNLDIFVWIQMIFDKMAAILSGFHMIGAFGVQIPTVCYI